MIHVAWAERERERREGFIENTARRHSPADGCVRVGPMLGREDHYDDGDCFTGDRQRVPWSPGPYSGRCDAYFTRPLKCLRDWRQARCTQGPLDRRRPAYLCAKGGTANHVAGEGPDTFPHPLHYTRTPSCSECPATPAPSATVVAVCMTRLQHAKTVGPCHTVWHS